jgi:hypothetical protein
MVCGEAIVREGSYLRLQQNSLDQKQTCSTTSEDAPQAKRRRNFAMIDLCPRAPLAACPDTCFDLNFVVGMVYSGVSWQGIHFRC